MSSSRKSLEILYKLKAVERAENLPKKRLQENLEWMLREFVCGAARNRGLGGIELGGFPSFSRALFLLQY